MFDLQEFIRLLKKYQSSESSPRVGDEKDEREELQDYVDEFKFYVLYQNRANYLELVERFARDPKMSFSEFNDQFFDLYQGDQARSEFLQKDFERLATFPIVEESKMEKVAELISTIFEVYDCKDDMLFESKSQNEIEEMFRKQMASISNCFAFED